MVLVLGQPFRVEYVSGLDGDTYGKAMVAQQRLLVREGQGHHQERETLVHELLHTIGSTIGHELDEHQVSAIAPVLFDVLRHNPELVGYLTEPTA